MPLHITPLQGKDKKLSVGDKICPASLLTHLNTHPIKSEEYNKAMADTESKKGNHLNTRSNKIKLSGDKQHSSRLFRCISKGEYG